MAKKPSNEEYMREQQRAQSAPPSPYYAKRMANIYQDRPTAESLGRSGYKDTKKRYDYLTPRYLRPKGARPEVPRYDPEGNRSDSPQRLNPRSTRKGDRRS